MSISPSPPLININNDNNNDNSNNDNNIYIIYYIFRALRGSWSIYEGTSGPSRFVVNRSRYFGFSKVVDLAESFRMH